MIKELARLGSYQLSTLGPGAVASGLENIRQCIDLILRTPKGSDPLRPDFGCDVFQFADKPAPTAIPNVKKAIIDALSLWETRVNVTAVTHEQTTKNLFFDITYVTAQGLEQTLRLALNNDEGLFTQPTTGVIITAFIPTYLPGGRYFVSLLLDGEGALPQVPAFGFASAAEMLAWLNVNYKNYGRWFVADGRLLLYLSQDIKKTVSLTVTQTVLLTLKAEIFNLNPGEFYNLALTLNGVLATPAFPEDEINNIEALFNWVNTNWANYGNWFLQSESATGINGDFNEDFNTDFDTTNITGKRFLILQTSNYENGILEFI